MLAMLERDKKVKTKPERWQDEKSHFDLVITYESRVFDVVVQGNLALLKLCLEILYFKVCACIHRH